MGTPRRLRPRGAGASRGFRIGLSGLGLVGMRAHELGGRDALFLSGSFGGAPAPAGPADPAESRPLRGSPSHSRDRTGSGRGHRLAAPEPGPVRGPGGARANSWDRPRHLGPYPPVRVHCGPGPRLRRGRCCDSRFSEARGRADRKRRIGNRNNLPASRRKGRQKRGRKEETGVAY